MEALLADWRDPERGKPLVVSYSPRDFGTEALNWSVVVDRKGRLYLGNDRVQEFDGRVWKTLSLGDGKRTVSVRSMDLDGEGRLWIVANDEFGYFEEDQEGRRHYRSLRALVPAGTELGELWQLYCVGAKVVFNSASTMFVWDGRQVQVHPLPNESRLSLFRVGKEIWVSRSGHGLFRFDGNRLAPIDTSEAAKDTLVWAVLFENGDLLAGGRSGLLRLKRGKWEPVDSPVSEALRQATQVTAVALPNGEIWVATLFGGIYILDYNGDVLRVLNRTAGLPRHPLTSLWLQPSGDLWVTSTHGLSRLETQAATTLFDSSLGFDAGAIRATVALGEGTTVFGAEDGVLRLEPAAAPEKIAQLRRIPGPGRLHWSGLALDQHDALFAGSRGLSLVRPGESTPVYSSPVDVFQLARVPGRRDLFLGLEGDKIFAYSPAENDGWSGRLLAKLPNSGVDLQVDPQGRVWYSTWTRGVTMLAQPWETEEPARREFTPGMELPLEFARADFFQTEGRIFAFSENKVYELGDGPPRPIELPRNPFLLLVESNPIARGPAWGVARWPGETPRLVRLSPTPTGLQCQAYPLSVLGAIEQPLGISRAEGATTLWVSGSEGLLRIETPALKPDEPPASPRLTGALWRTDAGDQSLPLRAQAAVPFDETGVVVLDFRVPGAPIESPTDLQYRFALESPWVPFRSPLTLTGLHEGLHRLEVRAVSGPFPSSHPTEFELHIEPPWHRHPWMYFLYIVAGGAVLAGAVSWRLNRIRSLNTSLRELVDRRTAELTRATDAKAALLSTMGHELLNPLNGVVGLAESLRHATLPQAEAEMVSRLANCAAQLSSVVEDVMEHARLEAGRVSLRLRPFALREPVEAALDIFRSIQSAGQSEIHVEAEPALLEEVRIGASDRIRHILVNYLSNALKFGAGRPVIVRVASVGGDRVEFAVEDRGPGLREEESLKLFNRFQRGRQARRLGIPGTGLGLAACKVYAEAMGGEVGVASTVGVGSTFFVRLPLARPAGDEPRELLVSTDHLQGMVVLVLDDHDFNREVLCRTLERLGAQPCGAADLGAARVLFHQRKPDLVLADFDLGAGTGADFAAWVRHEAAGGRDVPIIATTAYELSEVRQRCLQAGMDGFLPKPITEWKLREAVARIDRTRSGEYDQIAPRETPAPGMIDLLSGGDPARREELLASAWVECRKEVCHVLRAQRKGDLPSVQRGAHRLISVAVLLEWEALTRTVQAIHHGARQGDAEAVALQAAEIRRLLKDRSGDWRRRRA